MPEFCFGDHSEETHDKKTPGQGASNKKQIS